MSTGQRITLRVLSALVALALIAGACLLIGQVVLGMTSGGSFLVPTADWYESLRMTPWDDASVVYVGIGLVVVGFLLLVAVVLARPRLFSLARPEDHVDVVIAPRAVAQMLRRQAETVPGVGSASAEVSRDLARISVTAPLASPPAIEQELASTLTHGLKQIPWARMPRLEIEVIGAQAPPSTSSIAGTPRPENLVRGAR